MGSGARLPACAPGRRGLVINLPVSGRLFFGLETEADHAQDCPTV